MNSGLETIAIGESVETIYNYAFYNKECNEILGAGLTWCKMKEQLGSSLFDNFITLSKVMNVLAIFISKNFSVVYSLNFPHFLNV